jgi:hypothetical protein
VPPQRHARRRFDGGVCNSIVINPTPNGNYDWSSLAYYSPSSTFSDVDAEILMPKFSENRTDIIPHQVEDQE